MDAESVIVTLCDITAPISEDNKRAITSPYYTKSSTTPILRDYYLLIEANKAQPAAVPSDANAGADQPSATSEDDEDEAESKAKVKREKKKPEVSLDQLKEEMINRMIARLPT